MIPDPSEAGGLRRTNTEGRLVLRLHINGHEQEVVAPAHHTLQHVLHSQLRLLSVREACGVGMCGACTVLVDGKAVSSCLTFPFQVEGREILTVEGLEDDAGLHPIQEAFAAKTAFQCSYCTPGFILMSKALLDESPDADLSEAREYLGGNLCRCGSYIKILEAVMDSKQRTTKQVGQESGNSSTA